MLSYDKNCILKYYNSFSDCCEKNENERTTAVKTRDLTLIGVCAAVICVLAPWKINITLIPVTLATFAIYLVSAVLGPVKGSLAVLIYILLGAMGLPVFSGFVGGFQALVGPTGGYIIGYVPMAFIIGYASKAMKSAVKYPLGMIVGTFVLYAFGTAWFCISRPSALAPALAACVLPFIGFDLIKIAAASIAAYKLKPALAKTVSAFVL